MLFESLWPKPPGLRFNSHQDALDFVAHCMENSKRVATPDPRFLVVESYAEGKAVCVAKVSSACTEDFDLVVFRDPFVFQDEDEGSRTNLEAMRVRRHWHENGVLLDVTKTVQIPDGVVASLVWLKASNEGLDFVRRLLADALHPVDEVGFVLGDGKMDELDLGSVFAARDTGGIDALIENGTHVVDAVKDDTRRLIKERLIKLDLVPIVAAFSISLDKVGPLFCLAECSDPRFKITEVVFCPL